MSEATRGAERKSGCKVKPWRDDLVVRLYREGKTLRQVAALLDISPAGAKLALVRRGEPRRRSSDPSYAPRKNPRETPEEVQLRIVERYRSGMSAREAGEPDGVLEWTASEILRRRGIEKRGPKFVPGYRFGPWTVLERLPGRKGAVRALASCCGEEKVLANPRWTKKVGTERCMACAGRARRKQRVPPPVSC